MWGWPGGLICGAVVFSAYDQHGTRVARAARPATTCTNAPAAAMATASRLTLDASSVVGGIRRIKIDLWEWDQKNGAVVIGASATYYRP